MKNDLLHVKQYILTAVGRTPPGGKGHLGILAGCGVRLQRGAQGRPVSFPNAHVVQAVPEERRRVDHRVAGQEGAVPWVVDVSTHPGTLVKAKVCAHAIQVVAVPVACKVVCNGFPSLCELFGIFSQAPVGQAQVVRGVAVEDAA